MKELLIIFAKSLPEDQVITMLEEAIVNYKSDPSKETKNKLLLQGQMLMIKIGTEDKDIESVMKEADEVGRIRERMSSDVVKS